MGKHAQLNNQCIWIGIGINFTPLDKEYLDFLSINQYLIQKYKSTYQYHPPNNQPHLNLYDLDIPMKNLNQIKDRLSQIAKTASTLIITPKKLSFFDYGVIYINYKLDITLKSLEQKIVDAIAVYRGNCRTKGYWSPTKVYTKEQLISREKYGNPYVGSTYNPHITVGFVKTNPERLKKIVKNLNKMYKPQPFKVNRLDLVVHDQQQQFLGSASFRLN